MQYAQAYSKENAIQHIHIDNRLPPQLETKKTPTSFLQQPAFTFLYFIREPLQADERLRTNFVDAKGYLRYRR
jgi:hypothetical protein